MTLNLKRFFVRRYKMIYDFSSLIKSTGSFYGTIFSRQTSLAQQAFLITPLHGARHKTGKNAYAKK